MLKLNQHVTWEHRFQNIKNSKHKASINILTIY